MQEILNYIKDEHSQLGLKPEKAAISSFRMWSGVTRYAIDISFRGRTYRTCTFTSEEETNSFTATLQLQYGTKIIK